MSLRPIRCRPWLACALLLAAAGPASAQLAPAEREALVGLHDDERCAVDPAAAAMPALDWDPLLAAVAQGYAQGCTFAHNASRASQYAALGGSGSVGENIAMGTAGFYGPTDLAQLWADEQALWSYGPVTNSNFQAVGHYTQMIWANTRKVGCGAALCSGMLYLVCNYAPAGNYLNQAPYAAGPGTNEACGGGGVPEPASLLGGLAALATLAMLGAGRARGPRRRTR